MEGYLIIVAIVFMAIYLIGSSRSNHRHPRNRFGRQHPNQPNYGYNDDFDDYDDYPQQYYPQQYPGNQPIIIMPGAHQYPPRHYRGREDESFLPPILAIVAMLSIGAAIYFYNNKEVNVPSLTNTQLIEEEVPQGQKTGYYLPVEQERKIKVVPEIPVSTEPRSEQTGIKIDSNKDFYIVYLGEYSSIEGVKAIDRVYENRKIIGLKTGDVYWACVVVKTEGAAWKEMRAWNSIENNYRSYGLDPEIRNLRNYCGSFDWSPDGDMLICD